MRTAVSETSREAFHSLPVAGYLQPKEAQVLSVFRGAGDTFTRQQLVDAVGMPLNAICGRANSLLAKKVLCVRGFSIDPHTRKRQELLGLPVARQGALF
jgi:hypothetical protein